jgi:hypothetical protein
MDPWFRANVYILYIYYKIYVKYKVFSINIYIFFTQMGET